LRLQFFAAHARAGQQRILAHQSPNTAGNDELAAQTTSVGPVAQNTVQRAPAPNQQQVQVSATAPRQAALSNQTLVDALRVVAQNESETPGEPAMTRELAAGLNAIRDGRANVAQAQSTENGDAEAVRVAAAVVSSAPTQEVSPP